MMKTAIIMRNLLFLALLSLFSCNGKPSKLDALNFYEQIYKASVDTRTGERKLIDEMAAYVDEVIKLNGGKIDSLRLQSLVTKNEKVIEGLKLAKQNINSIPDFNYEKDLKRESSNVLDKQLALHQNGISNTLNGLLDGKVTIEDIEEMKNTQKEFEVVKATYQDWKAIRREFCKEFGITYEDIKVFEDKYNPTEEETEQE